MAKKICLLIVGMALSVGVFAQSELSYRNGVWQNGSKITPDQVRTLMAKNKEALAQYNTGRGLFIAGPIIAIPAAFLVGWDLGTRLAKKEGNNALLIGSVAGSFLGLVMSLVGEEKMKNAVSLYNATKPEPKKEQFIIQQINLGLTQTGGVGVSVRF